MEWLELDGSQGEGGGQILRTALTLSMITRTPLRIVNIRAGRSKPGLLRQHLTAVNAAAEICGAEVIGAEAGSKTLSFVPGPVCGGDYRYAIGTAGSCTLVLQTVLPALWFANAPSTVTVSGGTHNPAAPPADFLLRSWLPLMHRMGVVMDIELLRHGFYPAGGGEIRARISPVAAINPLTLASRGKLRACRSTAIVSGVPYDVARRELEHLTARLGPHSQEVRTLASNEGPGNVLLVELEYDAVCEMFISFGEKGVPAETVANQVSRLAMRYRDASAVVGEHLADQLLLPMALAGGGAFTTTHMSSHLRTNIDVIEKFLPVHFEVSEDAGLHRVGVS